MAGLGSWLGLALLAALCLAGYHFFIKLAAGHIAAAAGAVMLQLVAAALGGVWLLSLHLKGAPLSLTGRGLAALAGLGVGLAKILTVCGVRAGCARLHRYAHHRGRLGATHGPAGQ